MKVLLTCPPMLGMIDKFISIFDQHEVKLTTPSVIQSLSINELKEIVPQHDGWIIGDDPATRDVISSGRAGKLRAAVKWGIGIDNVDLNAFQEFGIPFTNTPNMFGNEVADIGMGYVTALARETFQIDDGVRKGAWPKPRGISLSGKNVALVGFGDIGKNVAKRMLAADMKIVAYDPAASPSSEFREIKMAKWPERIEIADFIVFTCALTTSSHHMLNSETLNKTKQGVRLINVGRGSVIDETALISALQSGRVYSAALDVFEVEPLPLDSYLRKHPRCIFGSHNASNTLDAVERTSFIAIEKLFTFLGVV